MHRSSPCGGSTSVVSGSDELHGRQVDQTPRSERWDRDENRYAPSITPIDHPPIDHTPPSITEGVHQMYSSTRSSPKLAMGLPAIVSAMACAFAPAHIACAQTGACCVAGGGVIFCSDETEDSCASLGGVFQGIGTTCERFPCDGDPGPIGACCSPGTCFESTKRDCSGTWLGPGTTCDPFPCELPRTGACCFEDVLFCFETTEATCALAGGTFHLDTPCADLKCGGGDPQDVGACCLLDPFGISCVITTEALCAKGGGAFHGVGSVCDPLPCEPGTGPIGACCILGGGLAICSILHESHCLQLGGVFQGEGVVCEDVVCVPRSEEHTSE